MAILDWKRQVGIALLGVVSLAGLTGCPSGKLHEINRINKQIEDDLNAVVVTAGWLHEQKNIDDSEAAAIGQAVSEAADAKKVLNAQLRTLASVDSSNIAQVLGWVQAFEQKLSAVGSQAGHVKNPDSQKKLQLAFSAMDAALTTLTALLVGVQHAPLKAGFDAASEVALGLAAFQAIVGLLAKWRADGLLTDLQLQDAMDVENDDSKKRALALIAAATPVPRVQ